MMRMIMGGNGQEPGWFLKIRGGLGELGECGAVGAFTLLIHFLLCAQGEVGCLGQSSGG